MLTVQETLKRVDPNELISGYATRLLSYSTSLFGVPDSMTIGELLDEKKHKASIILDNLLAAEIKEESDAILLAHHCYSTTMDDIKFSLVEIDDIMDKKWKEKAQSYCYMAETFEKIAAYKIADTYLTQRYLTELLIDVMYESAWMGPNQEHRDDFIASLDESMKNKEKSKPIEELWDSIRDVIDWEPEKRDKKEFKKERKLNRKTFAYNRDCFLREVEKVRKSLKKSKRRMKREYFIRACKQFKQERNSKVRKNRHKNRKFK